MKRVAVITGSRAEYGIMKPLMQSLKDDQGIDFQLIVTGSHLVHVLGRTIDQIKADGFEVSKEVDLRLEGDSQIEIATAMGRAVAGIADAYNELKPDLIILLGDRYEIFAAASAAVPLRIPVAHLHGGEVTHGAIDDAFRHAITKLSHLHFCSTETYRDRIIQMGEDPECVFCVGAPGLDGIASIPRMSKDEFCAELGIDPSKRLVALTYHPETLSSLSPEEQMNRLLVVIQKRDDVHFVCTGSNADPGGQTMTRLLEEFAKQYPDRAIYRASLGGKRYFSLLEHAECMIGNSSSGIIESSSFCLPVVNIGDRQGGRVRANNVIDVPCEEGAIQDGLEQALSSAFQSALAGMVNPYGDGRATERILETLRSTDFSGLQGKRFRDKV